jgi:hypothetical protein
MGRTYAYSISFLLLLSGNLIALQAQDTILFPLKIRIGIEVTGPAKYISDKNVLNTEGFISVDLNEKRSATIAAGYLNYKYSQYNYSYLNHGNFVRIGMDFNFFRADKSAGKYFAGIGLRYGLSRFTTEVPTYDKTNYWGETVSSIPSTTYWGHFLEAAPGFRAEIFNHFSMGWTVSLRMLVHTTTGNDLRPINFPGFGNGTKTFSTALSYYLIWNIPYKKINAIIKKEAPAETENTEDTGNSANKKEGTAIKN